MTSLSTPPDKRLNAYRDDLADTALEGQVEARRFVAGTTARVVAPICDLRFAPEQGAGIETQAIYGEAVKVFDAADGWSWVQLSSDGYVGYVRSAEIDQPAAPTNHIVCVPRTFIYAQADLRSAGREACSIGSRLNIVDWQTTRGTRYGVLADGSAVVAGHIRAEDTLSADPVTLAADFLNTPYLWGGRSGFGLDCSALVQLCMAMCGNRVLRDTDMQAASIGTIVDAGPDYARVQRGDLMFWNGHVAFVEDDETLIHASGHAMQVVREGLRQAVERIAYLYQQPTCVRRP